MKSLLPRIFLCYMLFSDPLFELLKVRSSSIWIELDKFRTQISNHVQPSSMTNDEYTAEVHSDVLLYIAKYNRFNRHKISVLIFWIGFNTIKCITRWYFPFERCFVSHLHNWRRNESMSLIYKLILLIYLLVLKQTFTCLRTILNSVIQMKNISEEKFKTFQLYENVSEV